MCVPFVYWMMSTWRASLTLVGHAYALDMTNQFKVVNTFRDGRMQRTTSPSPVEGMQWCETLDPTTCPLVRSTPKTIQKNGQTITVDTPKVCLDEPVSKQGEEWCHSCDVNLRVCDWLPIEKIPETDPCVDARLTDKGIMCRTCDLSMGLGSSSLTMVELVRAYSAFATYGTLVEPYFIESVKDRDGTIIEQHQPETPEQVLDSAGITIAIGQVATGGTAKTNR